MKQFEHLLVATDFGQAAGRALDVAVDVASRFDAKITLLHVGWVPPVEYDSTRIPWPSDELALAAKSQLDAAVAAARTKAGYSNLEGALVVGLPWEQILSVARDRAVDLIVMGTNGRHGLSHFVLGSVAERVVRLSPIPVLTVGPSDRSLREPKGVA
jgi:nucleotide-binding universal stress UspA family protein